ncbi:hypothetical protein BDV18DRAFT_37997 [Aspergillus unguis]
MSHCCRRLFCCCSEHYRSNTQKYFIFYLYPSILSAPTIHILACSVPGPACQRQLHLAQKQRFSHWPETGTGTGTGTGFTEYGVRCLNNQLIDNAFFFFFVAHFFLAVDSIGHIVSWSSVAVFGHRIVALDFCCA